MPRTKIADLICDPVCTGFFTDDQAAIRAGSGRDGFLYRGQPLTAGFRTIRQPGEAVSVLLVLSDGQVAVGDCTSVQYSGVGGRDPVFTAEDALIVLREHVAPLLADRTLTTFRELAGEVDGLLVNGRHLHTAVRYGVTQALLHAVAISAGVTMAEVVRTEYETGADLVPVPIYTQSGDERYTNVDKMITKEVDVLPHGLINHVGTKLGADGSLLKDYVSWLRNRILSLRKHPGYMPRLHIDVYGTIGVAFEHDIEVIASYLGDLADLAAPFSLQIEQPVDAGNRQEQIKACVQLRAALAERGAAVRLVVDEWCNSLQDIKAFVAARAADVIHVKTPDLGGVNNSIEALLHVRSNGLASFCGGTCNETDVSARVSANIAMACGADQILAKPGMGVDEGLMIVSNEMIRTASLARRRAQITAGSGLAEGALT
jgi:methylaspartate ammonia-lyase